MPRDPLRIGDHVRVHRSGQWESGLIVDQRGEELTFQSYDHAQRLTLDPTTEVVKLPSVLIGSSLIVTEAGADLITTDLGVRFRLEKPSEHVNGKHADPAVGNGLVVTAPTGGQVLDIDALVLVESGCGCQNIGLRVVSVGAATQPG